MRQSNIIFGTLLFAFVIYITLRGQLPEYIALFTGASPNTAATDNQTSENNSNDFTKLFDSFMKANELFSNMGVAH